MTTFTFRCFPLLILVACTTLACVFASTTLTTPVVSYRHKIRVPVHWKRTVKSNSRDRVVITFALKQRNVDKLKQLLDDVSDPRSLAYGKYLTNEELIEMLQPEVDTIRTVTNWLTSFDINDYKLTGSKDFIVARMTVAQAESIFNTEFHRFEHTTKANKVINRAVVPYTIPESVARQLDFIAGVHSFPRIHKVVSSEAIDASLKKSSVASTPQLLREMYRIGNVKGESSKNLQAVVSFLEQYYLPSDLDQFFDTFNLTRQPVERVIGPNDESNPGIEAELDIQYLMGVAQGVRTWIWSVPGLHEDQEPFLEWLLDVSATSNIPYVFSISYQDYEETVNEDYAKRVDIEFMKLCSRGSTLVTGSGDWGVGCNDTCNKFSADFPSSSPYMVSTGGTEFFSDTQLFEKGVNFSSGGFSYYFDRPMYQDAAIFQYFREAEATGTLPPTSYFNKNGRGFPDVSAMGVNFKVVVQGKIINVGGTSASTPTFASMVSLINDLRLQKGLPTMGWINPFLYLAAERNPGAYQDITLGNNKYGCCPVGFTCVKGWDPMTGLGTPNFAVLSSLAMDTTMFPALTKKH